MAHQLDWDHLRVFLAAHRAGSLRGASEKLKVNHATVRRALDGLENSLGTRIFERSTGGLSLTQPGEFLVEHAEEIERQTSRISRSLTGLDAVPSGIIRVSLPPSFAQAFFAPILGSFTIAYPDIQVKVIATNRISNLAKNEADVSIRVAYEVDDDVVGRRLLRFVIGTYATPKYLAAHPDLNLGDGRGAHWVGWGNDHEWIKQSPFPNAKPRHILPEIYIQLEAAANHIGMTMLPCFVGDNDPRLVRVPGAPIESNRSIWVLLHGDLRKTARVRAFVDHATAYILAHKENYTA